MSKKEMDDFVSTNSSWQFMRKRKPLYCFRNFSYPKKKIYYKRSDKFKRFVHVERDVYRPILLQLFMEL